MSAIGGICNLGGPDVDPIELTMLGIALTARGPDGGNDIIDGSIGMAYRAFHTNSESRVESQPVVSRFGHMLSWDGRLDNRDDLLGRLGNQLDLDKTDAALIMAAYQEWGTGFLSKIIGDFALSLWDPLWKTLILARDPFGSRTLYYYKNNNRIIWASTLGSLLALPAIGIEINDDYVAGCLALYPELSSSPYQYIHAVEPGHALTVNPRQFKTQRSWRPDPNCDIRYRSDGDYEEHFLHLFREAVQCRLRADGPVWSELSGGLDSSSIVCMADSIKKSSEVETLSYIADESSTFYDRRFIEVVEQERGRKGIHINGNGHWVHFASPEECVISKPVTSLCVADIHETVRQKMKNYGARVLLSGLGGDQVTWSTPEPGPQLTDLLFQFRPILLHRQLQIWSRLLMKPYAQLLWQEVLLPQLPDTINARFQTRMPILPWLNRDFVSRMKLCERLLPPRDPFGYRLPSRRMQSSKISYIVMNIARGEYWEHSSYDKTYPFLHRPLVEFLINVPVEQKLRPSETRSLMRRALKDLLPDRVLKRKSKGTTGEAFCRGLARQWPVIKPMLADARICSRGYVDRKALNTALDQARHGWEFNISAVYQTLCIEIWLRSIEHHYGKVRRSAATASVQGGPNQWTKKLANSASAR
ncbi:MAG: asparagine synthase-related protein [Pyrinomonadaceae bacterium]